MQHVAALLVWWSGPFSVKVEPDDAAPLPNQMVPTVHCRMDRQKEEQDRTMSKKRDKSKNM